MIIEASQNPDEIFFWKKDGKHSGKGVFPMKGSQVITNITDIPDYDRDKVLKLVFVQKAVPKMALIDGAKFDIRTYLLIPTYEPFMVFYFEQHYLRRSLSKYVANSTAKSVHMTNLAVFEKNKGKLEEDAVWHWERFVDYVNEGHFPFDIKTVEQNLENALLDMAIAFKDFFPSQYNSKWWFANFACDFMLDMEGNLHFIEFVWLPAMSLKTDMLRTLKTEYGEEVLNILFEVAELKKNNLPICAHCLKTPCDMKLLRAWDIPTECSC